MDLQRKADRFHPSTDARPSKKDRGFVRDVRVADDLCSGKICEPAQHQLVLSEPTEEAAVLTETDVSQKQPPRSEHEKDVDERRSRGSSPEVLLQSDVSRDVPDGHLPSILLDVALDRLALPHEPGEDDRLPEFDDHLLDFALTEDLSYRLHYLPLGLGHRNGELVKDPTSRSIVADTFDVYHQICSASLDISSSSSCLSDTRWSITNCVTLVPRR